jgi:hypothetical protein
MQKQRLNLIALSLLVGLPALAATRLYLPSTTTCFVDPPDTLQASWGEATAPECRATSTSKVSSALTSKTQTKSNTANVRELMFQYVSLPLDGAQTISGTVKGTIRVLESAANDNLDKVSMKLIVVNNAGTALSCSGVSLLDLADYGPTNEWDIVLENRRIADGDTITSCNTADGDRIVIEIGMNNTVNGASVSGTMNVGDDQAGDCADDETTQTACNPFLEFSVTLTFKAEVTQKLNRMLVTAVPRTMSE